MATYYKYTVCSTTSVVAFYSNEPLPPTNLTGNAIKFTSGVPAEYLGSCYVVTAVTVPDPVPFVPVTIDWSTATYNTYTKCNLCEAAVPYLKFTPCVTTQFSTTYITNYEAGILGNVIKFPDLLPGTCFTVELIYLSTPPAGLITVDWATEDYELFNDCAVCRSSLSQGCVQLEDCSDNKIKLNISNTSLTENSIVKIDGYPNTCWVVGKPVTCDNPVFVTVVQNFKTCVSCQETLPVVNYQLTDCNNPEIVIYTSTNLSDYVDHTVTLDEYPDECFYVTVLDTQIPSDTPVTVKDSYADCQSCLAPHYLLTDCAGLLDDIVTNTDLSANVGDVITIASCPDTCWFVEETDITAVTGTVSIVSTFVDCPTCLVDTIPAKCVTFTNTTSEELNFDITTSSGTITKFTIAANSTSAKGCYIDWTIPTTIVVTEYGNCVNGVCPPEPAKPRRKVRPGYDTPACTAEYYEKVECTFSEWMYKDVLEKRYGISNCCPADLMRWEIKHEMLMLDALINPDYTCVPPVNCGCPQPTTCNCSCNSGN